jgi:hypothetical protein
MPNEILSEEDMISSEATYLRKAHKNNGQRG